MFQNFSAETMSSPFCEQAHLNRISGSTTAIYGILAQLYMERVTYYNNIFGDLEEKSSR